MSKVLVPSRPASEREVVGYRTPEEVAWRFSNLRKAGYPEYLAERIADSGVDLHQAVDLVTVGGCPPRTAAKILL